MYEASVSVGPRVWARVARGLKGVRLSATNVGA